MIETIDVSSLSDDGPNPPETLESLRTAFSETGFAVVTGHGVSGEALRDVEQAARSFFSLSPTAKLGVAPRRWNPDSPNRYRGYFPSSVNGKEGLDLGDPALDVTAHAELLEHPYYELNRLPEELPPPASIAIDRYFGALWQFGTRIASALAQSLGGDPTAIRRALERPSSQSTLRFNAYPEGSQPVEISAEDGARLACETHVDSGFITILYQDRRGGLQVRDRSRSWLDVPYLADAFVVNLGRAGHTLSGGGFRATPHRVIHEDGARLSIPFFLEPRHDFPITPASLGLSTKDEVAAPAPSYEAFLDKTLTFFKEYAGR